MQTVNYNTLFPDSSTGPLTGRQLIILPCFLTAPQDPEQADS